MISLTKHALKKFVEISKKQKVDKILFSVIGGGCNGFKYNIELFLLDYKRYITHKYKLEIKVENNIKKKNYTDRLNERQI